MIDMISHQFTPALMAYMDKVASLATKKQAISSELSLKTEITLMKKLSGWYEQIDELSEMLVADTAKAETIEDSLEAAKFYQSTILKDMEEFSGCWKQVKLQITICSD